MQYFYELRELLINILIIASTFLFLYGTTLCRSKNNGITWQSGRPLFVQDCYKCDYDCNSAVAFGNARIPLPCKNMRGLYIRCLNAAANLVAEPCERLLAPPKKIQMSPLISAFSQMRSFSIQLQISPLSRAISKPNQAILIMFSLGENNFHELPRRNK